MGCTSENDGYIHYLDWGSDLMLCTFVRAYQIACF